MASRHDPRAERHRAWYAALLRLYPEDFRSRFAESMEQTFADLYAEHRAKGGVLPFLAASFADTSAAIIKECAMAAYTKNRSFTWLIAGIVALLTVPFVLTVLNPDAHFNGGTGGGWDWGPGDFLVMGVLLFAAGSLIIGIMRLVRQPVLRLGGAAFVLLAFLLVWGELATGGISRMLMALVA